MKRWLRRITNTLMALSLVLGVVLLLLWPVSVYWDAYFDSDIWLPAKWERDDGPWYRSWSTETDLYSGWIAVSIYVDSLNRDSYYNGSFFDDGWERRRSAPDRVELEQLARDGYLSSADIAGHKLMQADIQWFPDENGWYEGKWGFDSSYYQPFGFDVYAPLWAVASIFLLPAFTWFTFVWWRKRRLAYHRRFNVCMHCDYDLRGSESETCPECGEARAMVTA